MDKDILDITQLNIGDIYKNTIQTIIDIINEVVIYYDINANNKSSLYDIFFKNDRMFYIGVILVILSFVIYFIDGVSI
jgi:hypothetical protein|uniref:Uncharacterized protein n=1 Tax=viral metagenome TaxID=1070528 RepID=A0A6C0DLJ2_9ZZZZ